MVQQMETEDEKQKKLQNGAIEGANAALDMQNN